MALCDVVYAKQSVTILYPRRDSSDAIETSVLQRILDKEIRQKGFNWRNVHGQVVCFVKC